MIKFFRKIRQNMIKENKVSKYMLYAIGEIILVVIGILIALSINTWNENRLKKNEAFNYLIQIKNELLIDINHFDSDIKLIHRNVEYLEKVSDGKYSEVDLTLLPNFLTKNLDSRNFGISFNKLKESGIIEQVDDNQLIEKLQIYYFTNCSGYNNIAKYHSKFNSENIEGPLLTILKHQKDFTVNSKEVIENLGTGNLISLVNWQISFLKHNTPYIENTINLAEELIKLIDITRKNKD